MARETSEMVLGRDIYERSWKTNSDNSALSVFASGSVNLESRGEQSHPGCSEVPLSTRPQHPCPPTKNRMLISKLTEGGGKKDLSNKADRGTLEQAPRSHSSSPSRSPELSLPPRKMLLLECRQFWRGNIQSLLRLPNSDSDFRLPGHSNIWFGIWV
ncbi:hypothetical protein D9757_009909 [Collybiopsis confluens]|uniref:Uncharacterized protein n=1 Tax=Collybiopsis confluens TaxID=2823264 RepID=A0A8H5LX00_9AGAR|nr:hypothetical protein D9757_009909 [Collybiopsis confluens]